MLFSYGAITWRVTNGRLIGREPAAYYELLTEAVVHGRTSLSLEPDPRLAQLANPWAGPQGIPRAHDATYFGGKYYLYFGVAPVVLVLAPWRIVTGTYLTDSAAILVFIAFGYLLGLRFVLRAARESGATLGDRAAAGVALALGWGAFLHYNLAGAQFYQVPIACAFACTMAAANALLAAWRREGRGAVAAWLAGGSFFAGAAVGARPNFLFVLPVFGVAGAALAWRRQRAGERRAALILLGATVGPAALVGAALAGYNYARFGDPLEFGLSYQFAAIDMRHFKLFGPEFFARCFDAYLLSPARYSIYYPFVGLREETFGLLTWAPAALMALGAPWFAWSRRAESGSSATGAATLFAAAAGVTTLGTLLLYSYQLERYELDFLGPLMVAAWVVALLAWPTARMLGRIVIGLSLAWTALHSMAFTLPPADTTRWAHVANLVPAAAERVLSWKHGPLELTVTMADCAVGAQQPLFATAEGRDAVFLQRTGGATFRVGFAHRGFPGVYGDAFEARPGERRKFVVDLGGLYPPAEHPFFDGWSAAEVAVLRRRVSVRCDGREVLRAESVFHGSSRLDWEFGTASGLDWIERRFSGRIESWRVLPFDRASVTAGLGSGPVRLRLRFPSFVNMVGEPLISTGRSGAGDLVYVFYVAPGRVRFAHDSWSSGLLESDVVSFDPLEEQVVDVDFGGLHPVAAPGVRTLGEFRLGFNGREVLRAARHYHPALASEVAFGYNAIRASTADVRFRGERLAAERLSAWPEPPADFGPIALTLRWPEKLPIGRAEPLLVTGRTGAADVIWVRYVDATHAVIGYDCWGRGGPQTPPLAIEPAGVATVQIALGNLFTPRAAAWSALTPEARARAAELLRVRVDGRVVLDVPAAPHPTAPAEIKTGRNDIGASSCAAVFSGEILRVQRVDPAVGG
ncbi:MAG: hypothetical protein HZA32_18830 [Opitutae bacterium]|nr:hypothetical protein [Opitutae bacterium]